MGLYVFLHTANFGPPFPETAWSWDYEEGQCANFGKILRLVAEKDSEIHIVRYLSERGEYIEFWGPKEEIIDAIKSVIAELAVCPLCQSRTCAEKTKKMLTDFLGTPELNYTNADELSMLWCCSGY